ncbi:MAG: hypothetical protein ABSA75_05355 [Candidatus Bathyarchaeia archaeon]|jgi:hypothetical protein
MTSVYADMTAFEKQVAEYLTQLGLYWKFEFPIFVYDEKNRPRVWSPDFYVPKMGMFVEVCGSENFDYKYREGIYKKNGFFVIFVHLYKEADQWKAYLVKRMMEIEEYRHDETQKMLHSLIQGHT